jgi:hypothetical protein
MLVLVLIFTAVADMTADEARPRPALGVEVEEQSTGALTRVSDATMLSANLLCQGCATTVMRSHAQSGSLGFDSVSSPARLSTRPSPRALRSTTPPFIVMSKATRRLPDALAALGLLATVAGLLPFGDKLSAGVNIAISLCEAAQVRPSALAQFSVTEVLAQTAKFNQSAYEDLSSRCTSLLLAVATCMRTADPKKRPIVSENMDALVQ